MPTDTERAAQLVREYFRRLLVERDLTVCDERLAADFVDHDAPLGTPPGPAATREFVARMLDDHPDLRFTIGDLVAVDGAVAVSAAWHGRHRHTGEVLHQRGLVLIRLDESGRFTERRAVYHS